MVSLKSPRFWLAILLTVSTVLLMIAVYYDLLNLSFRVNGLFFTHWLSIAGTLFIIIYTPIYYILKRVYAQYVKKLLSIHVFGNLLGFMLISIHFAGQVGRPLEFFPEGRTGVALYIITAITVASGISHRFSFFQHSRKYELSKKNRFVHVAFSLSFYIIVFVHILHNIGYL